MKNSWIAVLGLILGTPVLAQETPPPEQAAPAETAPASQPPTEATPAPAEAPAAPAEQPPAAAAPAEQPPAQPTAAEPAAAPPVEAEAPKEPWKLYAGLNYARDRVSSSGAGSLGTADYNSKFVDLRIGKRLFESVGLEFHYGLDLSDFDKGEIATDRYYGLFIVPTATMFETVELALPVGYGRGDFSLGKSRAVVNSVAYGFTAELPLRVFGADLPDLRFNAGWMVYNQKSNARVYGPSFGARYDFAIANPGNPFAGIGGWVKQHWPWGGGS